MKVLNFVHESCVQPEGVSPTISSLLFEHAAEVNTSDPALSALPASLCCFSVWVSVCLQNPAAGQLMEKRVREGQWWLGVVSVSF